MSQFTINFWSAVLAGPIGVNVLVPDLEFGVDAKQFFETHRKNKVIWLFHGGLCDENSWISYTNIARYIRGRDVIVVMPNGLNSDFADHPEFSDGFNVSKFFIDELMPFVHNWLPASSDPKDNFLFGYSMGAAAAWMFGLWHPELFGGIAPIGSPPKDYSYLREYRNLEAAEFRRIAMENPKKFPAGYGKSDAGIHLKEINMISKYPSVGAFLDSREHTIDRFTQAVNSGVTIPLVHISCDTGERLYGAVEKFKEYVEKMGVTDRVSFALSDLGLSEYDFCDAVLKDELDFFGI